MSKKVTQTLSKEHITHKAFGTHIPDSTATSYIQAKSACAHAHAPPLHTHTNTHIFAVSSGYLTLLAYPH